MNSVSPILYTQELEQTIAFYKDVLGFSCNNFDKDLGWTSLQFGGAQIMFSLPNAHIEFKKPTLTGSVYFYVDNVDELWEKLKENVEVCYPLEDFNYGMREFAIYDNNKYIIQFGKVIE